MHLASAWIREAFEELGIQHMAIAMQDAAFPADEAFDLGRGTPYSHSSQDYLSFLSERGFNVLQMGPSGQTSRGNASPYDGTLFSRNTLNLSLRACLESGLLPKEAIEHILGTREGSDFNSVNNQAAFETTQRLREELRNLIRSGFGEAYEAFERKNTAWMNAYQLAPSERVEQFILHQHHVRFRQSAHMLDMKVLADLHVGMSTEDLRAFSDRFLPGWVLGAPPSRTHPDGQPWGYPILHPEKFTNKNNTLGSSGQFFLKRIEQLFEDYDGLRIDHPHGWVDPWVYDAASLNAQESVKWGSRLYAAPDVAALSPFALVRSDQIRWSRPRYADDWVSELEDSQVERYGFLMSLLMSQANMNQKLILCEVLSTLPLPLERVLSRHGLGRFRVLQKAQPRDLTDVYLPHNAQSEDWLMLSTHDTPSIWQWTEERKRSRWYSDWVELMVQTLEPKQTLKPELARRLEADTGLFIHAMWAMALLSKASNFLIFFTDLFGIRGQYNRPGTVSERNWSMRVPSQFRRHFQELAPKHEVLSIEKSLEMALYAKRIRHELDLR